MSYTNVTLPNQFETKRCLREKIAELEFQMGRMASYIISLEREFQNIPDAIKEWGKVDLYDDRGQLLMTLVEKKEGAER